MPVETARNATGGLPALEKQRFLHILAMLRMPFDPEPPHG